VLTGWRQGGRPIIRPVIEDAPESIANTSTTPRRRKSFAQMIAFFDEFAQDEQRWRRRNRTYHRLLESAFGFLVPEGASVLELGSGSGDLLASLHADRGVGVDVSPRMVELARSRHPELEFHVGAAEEVVLDETFDYVILSDLVPLADDLLAVFENVHAMSHERTRVVINTYSQLWRPLIRAAELLRLKPAKPLRNWIGPSDLRNLLDLADLEALSTSRRILIPVAIPLVSRFVNGFVANVWPFSHLCVSYWVVARPRPSGRREHTVSVVVPCRNEAGTIDEIVERIPELGLGTEIVFVEGHSTDNTRAAIERAIAANPQRNLTLPVPSGRGKENAVREGFALAQGELLMILDGDLTVAPEDLPKFYDAVASGRAEIANGSRLVYDLEPGSMQFLNIIGNKLFSIIFSYEIGQPIKDTLCGTKVLLRRDYEAIARGRPWFGDFDPFGDFDLLLGGARLSLKIVDLPVRYGSRSYGSTNISRVRHGLLLARMSLIGFLTLKVRPNVLR
jgi:SAM-dependent methyltransferase